MKTRTTTLDNGSRTCAMAEPVGGMKPVFALPVPSSAFGLQPSAFPIKPVLALLIPLLWAALLISSAPAQNLFVASGGNILEFTPGGAQSTFASGVPYPIALAFNSAGILFVTTYYGVILEITPGGVGSAFASGLNMPGMLACDSAGNLFESDYGSGNIYEFTPDGTRSTFASGLSPSG